MKKKIIAILCAVALLAALLSTTAFAVTNEQFNATYNGIAGTAYFNSAYTKQNTDQYAYIWVSGYNASQGSTTVTITCTCNAAFATAYFSGTGTLYPSYSGYAPKGSAAMLRVTATTGVMGIGGYWRS